MTTSRQPPHDAEQIAGPLTHSLVTLAGTPDDASEVDAHLVTIAELVAETLAAVSFASVTAARDGAFTTVAASSALAAAVDQAQYDEQGGPCLDAFNDGVVVAVPNIATTMTWPGFRDVAFGMGLRASVSVPLFAGSGAPIAALNLYGHDTDTMTVLTTQIWAVFNPTSTNDSQPSADGGSGGAADFIDGLVAAFAVRAVLQQAIGVIVARLQCSPERAYLALRVRAAETGTSLAEVAAPLLDGVAWSAADERP